jgi:VanZ like family
VLAAAAAVTVFGVVLFGLTLTPLPESSPYVTDNTEPGATLRFYLDKPSVRMAVKELGGNLLLLVPLGVLLPVAVRVLAGPVRVALVAALLSLAIEVTQGWLVTGRSFDTDDVILNTTGAVLGYLLVGRRLVRWAHPG